MERGLRGGRQARRFAGRVRAQCRKAYRRSARNFERMADIPTLEPRRRSPQCGELEPEGMTAKA